MKVRHVFAAFLLACGIGQMALAQEETPSAAQNEATPAQASSEQEHKEAGTKKETRSKRHSRKHAEKTSTAAQASDISGNTAEKQVKPENAAIEKTDVAKADTVNAAPQEAVEQTVPAEKAAAEKTVAVVAPAEKAVNEQPVAEKAVPPATETPKSWVDGFIYSIKATDILVALFTGLLALIATTLSRRMHETVKATTETAQAAEKTALSAEKTARTAENALIAGQRAFMFLREFKTFLHLDDATGQYRWTLHPVWENNGNTPTKGLSIYTTYRLLDEPLPENYDFPVSQDDITATIAAPKALVEATPGSISAADLAAVQQGEKFFYIWGRAEYHDIFEGTGKHTTCFCNQLMQVIGDPTAPISEQNMVQMMFGFHSENNCAD